jgi:hypothetical protein
MNGPCSYGWRREDERTPSGRVLASREVRDPDTADVVREVTHRLLAGESLLAVTRSLNDRGVPSLGAGSTFRHKERSIDNPDGSRWSKTSVKKLAMRASNAGFRVFRAGERDERLIRGNWPALVDERDWRRVVALLGSPERRLTRPGARQHLLTWGIGDCGVWRPPADGAEGCCQQGQGRAVRLRVLAELAGPEAAERWDVASVATRRTVLETLGLRMSLLPVISRRRRSASRRCVRSPVFRRLAMWSASAATSGNPSDE